MVNLIGKMLGDPNDRIVKKYTPIAEEINSLESNFEAMSEDQLRDVTTQLKRRLEAGEDLDKLLPEAFAAVREAAKRTLGQRHYDVQLIGGVVLHQGKIAEMKTGEGKTLVSTLSVYLNALQGRGVHVVTVNDYLARRDATWMSPIYHLLGLTVGCLQQQNGAYLYEPSHEADDPTFNCLSPATRRDAYVADITYGTNNEFGFDYLRDNMVVDQDLMAQRELHYAIVDEVDNILIDEARTPLIISGPAEEPVQLYNTFARLVPRLIEDDYTIDDRTNSVSLTQPGIAKMEQWTKVGNLYDPDNFHLVHYMENALTAHVQRKRDKDYVVRDGQVVIVDEFTGRLQPGRRWSDGLHQAVEAKEGLKLQRESITYATITLQNYFRMYKKLAGMTGTALTEAEEFYKIYRLDVVAVPTHADMVREDASDLIFKSGEGKWRAVADEIKEHHEKGRPVLVGTTSIESSEKLSSLLDKLGITHQVLNAKQHEREASIVAEAGRPGAVTVATNMAGRGTDIVLGGNPAALDISREQWERDHQIVVSLGGLQVIGTEHHEARRIDNQLRGRSGRQGDPGNSRFYASLEDDLLRRFGGDRIKSVMGWVGLDDDTPIENRVVTKSLGNAQVKVEGHHFDTRKHLLDYDDVLNNQRQIIYDERRKALTGADLRDRIVGMVHDELTALVSRYLGGSDSRTWDVRGLLDEMGTIFTPPAWIRDEEKVPLMDRRVIEADLVQYADEMYENREVQVGAEDMRTLERLLMLRTVDAYWIHHLTTMDNLRQGIGLQAYGQRDPLVMYKTEGSKMFQGLLDRLQHDVVHSIFQVSLGPAATSRRADTQSKPSAMSAASGRSREAVAVGARKVGRNEPCPCRSGKKYKRCHGGGA